MSNDWILPEVPAASGLDTVTNSRPEVWDFSYTPVNPVRLAEEKDALVAKAAQEKESAMAQAKLDRNADAWASPDEVGTIWGGVKEIAANLVTGIGETVVGPII